MPQFSMKLLKNVDVFKPSLATDQAAKATTNGLTRLCPVQQGVKLKIECAATLAQATPLPQPASHIEAYL